MRFIQFKSLGGVTYIRAADVIAVQFTDRERCNVLLAGGTSLPCTERADAVVARIEAAVSGLPGTDVSTKDLPANADASD